MTATTRWAGMAATLVACAWAAMAADLPVMYLTPETYTPTVGQPLLLRAQLGTPLRAADTAWPQDRLASLFVLGGGTRLNRPTLPPSARDVNATEVTIAHPGVTVIGCNEQPQVTALTGEELRGFLRQNLAAADENPEVQALAGVKQVRVRRIASAVTQVRSPEAGLRAPSPLALAKVGLRNEIRPLMDPTATPVGRDVAVRVYVEGSKVAGAKVQATNLAQGTTQDKRTDDTGATYFTMTAAGTWRIEFHVAQKLSDDPEADWLVRSATLTFETPAEGKE